MSIHPLTYSDIQQVIATTHRVIANPVLAPVILELVKHSQTHQVRPESALMMMLNTNKKECTHEHQQ